MITQHYKGELGEFDYDNEEFDLCREYELHYLRYIGSEVDGSKICIPDGVVNCNNMFNDCRTLETPPVIPDSVEICEGMFYNCESLQTAPVIPDGVINCKHMFNHCDSLTTPPVIPDSVETCENMFSHCHNLKTPPVIPDGVNNCMLMFAYCGSLEIPPAIPDSVLNCEFMFENCKSLQIPPAIPDSVVHYRCMFYSCSDKILEWGKWNLAHRGHDYVREILIPDIARRSVSMYKQYKQNAVNKASEGKCAGSDVIPNDEFVKSDVVIRSEVNAEHDAVMEI